jgi:catechol 2,3-dioxygenase-like lactoylglutathione lyase family enzyme
MESKLIYGIQQIGIGVSDADRAFEWYATRMGSDVPIFKDNNVATYMAPYMGGQSHKKRAILAMNMQGGCGYELWQYLDRNPSYPQNDLKLGDLGINVAIVKSRDILKSYNKLKHLNVEILTEIGIEPDSGKSFYIKDPFNNLFRIKEFDSWYANNNNDIGGGYGCLIGVSNIDASLKLYSDILGYDNVIYDKSGIFQDLKELPNGDCNFRRILLGHKPNRVGGFSKLLGNSQLELIQNLDSNPQMIFAGRYWGDIGFIHLCFDIRNMNALIKECSEKGFPFKVLSSESFEMGDANGHWGYIEDSDGTLIEFAETHKVPLIKKLNWNINLKNRDPKKPIPDWMIKTMNLKRVRFKNK